MKSKSIIVIRFHVWSFIYEKQYPFPHLSTCIIQVRLTALKTRSQNQPDRSNDVRYIVQTQLLESGSIHICGFFCSLFVTLNQLLLIICLLQPQNRSSCFRHKTRLHLAETHQGTIMQLSKLKRYKNTSNVTVLSLQSTCLHISDDLLFSSSCSATQYVFEVQVMLFAVIIHYKQFCHTSSMNQ